MAVVSRKSRKRDSIFLFEKPDDITEDSKNLNDELGRKTRFFMISEGFQGFMPNSNREVNTNNEKVKGSNGLEYMNQN